MAKQICVAINLSAQEKALVNQLCKRMQCSRTDLVRLALRQMLEKCNREPERQP